MSRACSTFHVRGWEGESFFCHQRAPCPLVTKETPALPATWKVALARDDMPGVWAGGTAVCAEVVRDELFEESFKEL